MFTCDILDSSQAVSPPKRFMESMSFQILPNQTYQDRSYHAEESFIGG